MSRSNRRKSQRTSRALPAAKFFAANPETRGLLRRVSDALKIAEAIPQATIIILPPPTPAGLLQRLLAARNQ